MGSLLTGALLLTACSSSPTDSAGSGPDASSASLTVASTDSNEKLDPASEFVGWVTSRDGVTETLVGVDDKLDLVPELATSWKSTDASTWQITVRDGVVFHNGARLDAAAAKAAIEYAIRTNVRAQSQLPIESMTASGNTLTIRMSRPLPALPHILTDPMLSIQALGDGIDPATHPVATGPFKLEESVPQQRRVLSAHKKYWGGEPKLSHVTVKQYADAQAMALALQSGEVDVVIRPEAAGLSAFSDASRYTMWKTTSTRSDGIIVNTERPVMKDPRAREAIDYAIDRNAYVSLMHGMAKPTFAFFPENVSFGGEGGLHPTVTKKDMSKAKELFNQLGYTDNGGTLVKDGKPLTIRALTYSSRPFLGAMAQVLQSDLRSIGVTLEITELKSALDALQAGDFDLGMYSMATAPTGDPEYFFDTMLRAKARTNYSRYSSPTFDAKLAELSRTGISPQRIAITREIEQILLKDLPYIMFGNQQWWAVSNAKVHDLNIKPTEYHLLSHKTHVG